jgi:hypothetical protein
LVLHDPLTPKARTKTQTVRRTNIKTTLRNHHLRNYYQNHHSSTHSQGLI